jgi:two-component sensor histidine kinase
MTTDADKKPAVIESSPNPDSENPTASSLRQRIRQQELLAELGVTALKGATIEVLLKETARIAAEGLLADYCKVLEFIPHENRLLVRAGVGWDEGVVGIASVGADLASPAGYALKTGKPVISNHLENEERFRTSELLADHGVIRAMNVILQGDGKPFGVLEVDSRSEGDFDQKDLAFLQGAANLLGMGIERELYQLKLEAALARNEMLLADVNHRIKNSLSIIVSLFRLQAKDIGDPVLTGRLEEAGHRVQAIARAHDRLYQSGQIEKLDFGIYIEQVCRDLDAAVAKCKIIVSAHRGILVDTDRAISLALIINELVTNSAKYAYGDQTGCEIRVGVVQELAGLIAIRVEDDGVGLPLTFDLKRPTSLGMRIVTAFSAQLTGELSFSRLSPGTVFNLVVPVSKPS